MPAETPVKRTVVKASFNSIGWKPQYRQKLQELVSVVNTLTTHTYQFARFIFITELKQDPNFPLQQWIKKEFFVEVFLGLIRGQRGNREPTARTQYIRAIVTKHLTSYLAASSFELIELTRSQQIALYQAKAIEASYLNRVENYYGQHLKRIVNCLLDVKGRKKALQKELKERFVPEEDIKKSLAEEIFQPATAFKLAIARRTISRQSINPSLLDVFDKLQEVLGCYHEYYSFDKDNRYYDVKAHPEQHINAFYRMAAFCEQQTIKSFLCFPLRTSFVPGYMKIDTTILCHHFLLQPCPDMSKKMMYWARVVDLGS
jgi:hypothetical protein